MLEVLTAQNLKPLYGIKHGFFTRKGGVSLSPPYVGLNCGLSSNDTPNSVEENRRLAALYLEEKPENLLSCKQVHSPDVVIVKKPWLSADRPSADAMVTREQGIALGILTADCVPLLFADAKGGVIGAAHAGWRGALGGVIENMVRAMQSLGAVPSRIEAAIGPCIWQPSYEVSAEFLAHFLAENPDNQKFFITAARDGHYMFNLPGYVESKLRALGIVSIQPSPADTAADEERFFSYRRNCLRGIKGVGSLLSAIMFIAPPDDGIKPEEHPIKSWELYVPGVSVGFPWQ